MHLVKHSSFCFFSLVSSCVAAFLFLLGGISFELSDSELELLTIEGEHKSKVWSN